MNREGLSTTSSESTLIDFAIRKASRYSGMVSVFNNIRAISYTPRPNLLSRVHQISFNLGYVLEGRVL
jgi:hypothetical protein